MSVVEISKKSHPNCHDGLEWACSVRDGKIVVPKAVTHCVARFFKDLERAKEKNPPFFTDWDYAERFMRLTQMFHHVKGNNWSTKTITFVPWQRFRFMYLFGFMNSITKRRRFRTAAFWEPRGQGKSCIASLVGLYLLALDNELGPDIYCASTKKDAARIVLDSARSMAKKQTEFLEKTGTEVLAHVIKHEPSDGLMKAVSSDTSTNDGWNCSGIIADELHEWKRDLYDLADSSLSKRDDSLFFIISTAGFNTEGIGYEVYSYCKKVLEGHVEDDTLFAMIWEMDKGDDWQDPAVWRKANPNWGVSVDPINFTAKAKKAKETPAARNNFLVKHLNVWTTGRSAYFSLDHWDKCADTSLKLSQFADKKCAMGLDLATKVDLCSKVFIFKQDGKFVIFDKSYLPEARVMDNKNVQYIRWKEEGHLTIMPGEVNNFEKIQDDIIEDAGKYRIFGLNADPWSANETLQRLVKNRIPANEFRMTTQNLSEPMKYLDAIIREGKVLHNGSPLLRWCLGNVVAKMDANDNVFPRKNAERLKIDPIIAMIMGLAAWILEDEQTSCYEERDIRIL